MTRPSQCSLDPDCTAVIEVERRLDAMLREQTSDERFVRSLRATQQAWSQAVWTAAETAGASIPAAGDLAHGLRLARQPVFVCGTARSGTTLLRDLLDGHPQLVAIPHETGFHVGMERALSGMRSDRHRAYATCRWLEKLAARPPFWLLGFSTPERSPYVAFARDFAGWWHIPERHAGARISSWPLAAFALAYAQRLGAGALPSRAQMWVEKTPGNERFLARIWQDYPAAKVIQIVRRPEAVLASVKRMTPRRPSRRRTLAHIVGQMAPAYRVAADSDGRLPKDRYCVVRYEDLTADPDAVMARIAGFLGIDPLPSLLLPTVAGRPAINNSSFGASRPDPGDVLDRVDRALLALAIARPAAKLGYASTGNLSAATHAIVAGSRA